MKKHRSPLSALVFGLLAVVVFSSGCRDGDESNPSPTTGLAALTQRLEQIERQLAEQEKTHSAERQLMVKALEASTERLDTVLGALLSGKIKPAKKPVQSRNPELPPAKGKIAKSETKPVPRKLATKQPATKPPANATTEPPGSSDTGLEQVLVIFLAVSLLLLVVVVVFFPGRLRSSVHRVEYSAIEEEAIAGLQVDPDHAALAGARGLDPVAPRPSAFTPPATPATPVTPADTADTAEMVDTAGAAEDRPVPHELAIRVEDPDDITGLAEVLDRFLSTEPYILNEPAPQVALEDDELHLRFFALPTLSAAEHALLDDAVRRLTPPRTNFPGSPGPQRSAAS
jgi:hypothetical protein